MKPELAIQILSAMLAGFAVFWLTAFVIGVVNEMFFWIGIILLALIAFVVLPHVRKKIGIEQ